MDIERSLLITVAQEINEQLGLSPLIDTTMSDEILTSIIRKVCPLIESKDDFSTEAMNVLMQFDTLSEEVSTAFDVKMSFDSSPAETNTVTKNSKKAESTNAVTANGRKRKPHIIRMEELIAEGKYTSAQIIQIILSEFNQLKKDTVGNYIRGSRHEKYTLFSHTVIEDINGVLRFEDNK